MATTMGAEPRTEHLTRQIERGRQNPITLAQAAADTCVLATDLQARVDAYLRVHRELSPGQRRQLQQRTAQTALAAVRASLEETPERETVAYLKQAMRTARETEAILNS